MEKRQKNNEDVKKQIQELGKLSPTGQDILKYRLWQEQQGICMYSGKTIPLEELFKPGYDIDHILPQAVIKDDSLDLMTVFGIRYLSLLRKTAKRETGHLMNTWEMMSSVGMSLKLV